MVTLIICSKKMCFSKYKCHHLAVSPLRSRCWVLARRSSPCVFQFFRQHRMFQRMATESVAGVWICRVALIFGELRFLLTDHSYSSIIWSWLVTGRNIIERMHVPIKSLFLWEMESLRETWKELLIHVFLPWFFLVGIMWGYQHRQMASQY